jgi:hypothetical protein
MATGRKPSPSRTGPKTLLPVTSVPNRLKLPCNLKSTLSPVAPTESARQFPQNYVFGRSARRTSGHGLASGRTIYEPIRIRPPRHRTCTRAITGASSWNYPPWQPKPTSMHTYGWHLLATDSSRQLRPFGPTRRPSPVAMQIPPPRTNPIEVQLRCSANGGRRCPRNPNLLQAHLEASAALPKRTRTLAFWSWPPLLM